MVLRNIEKRDELVRQAREMEKLKKEAYKALDPDMDDDEWYEATAKLDKEYDFCKLLNKAHALEYPEARNKWFKEFVESFGTCESRRISQKQAAVFVRYSEESHYKDWGRGMTYYVRCNGKLIKTMVFTEREPAYVTITEY